MIKDYFWVPVEYYVDDTRWIWWYHGNNRFGWQLLSREATGVVPPGVGESYWIRHHKNITKPIHIFPPDQHKTYEGIAEMLKIAEVIVRLQ